MTSGPTAGSQGQAASPAPRSPVAAPTSTSGAPDSSAGTGAGSAGGVQPTLASTSPRPQAEPTLPAEATQQAAVQTATADGGTHYIDMARRAVPAAPRPGTDWDVQVIPTEDGPAVMLIMPLSQSPSNTSALAAAKQGITDVVNTVFVNDPKVVRLGVIGTYKNSAGKEVPAISLIVRKSASPRWGAITPAELERLAQTFYINTEFQK